MKEAIEQVARSGRAPKVLIQASAIGGYGTSQEQTFDESSPLGDDYLSSICRKWEESTTGVERWGVRRVIIRTGLVLSASGGVLPRMMLPFRFFAGGPLGSGKQVLSWIHITDQIRAMIHLMEDTQATGVFNLAAPEPVNNAVFGKTIAKLMRRPYWFPVPAFLMRLVLGEMSILVLEGQRVLPKKLLESGFRFQYPTLESALKNLLLG